MAGTCQDWDFRQALLNPGDGQLHKEHAVLRLIPARNVGCFGSFHNETWFLEILTLTLQLHGERSGPRDAPSRLNYFR